MDIYTNAHKSVPFVDGKLYSSLCFTCYFVPKIEDQKYDKSGSIVEEIQLPYCCDNICDPKELHEQGGAESIQRAKISINAVKESCKGSKRLKKQAFRPKANWNIC